MIYYCFRLRLTLVALLEPSYRLDEEALVAGAVRIL